MKDLASYGYERVIVTGRLVTKGPLHAGSGFEEAAPAAAGQDERSYRSLCLDAAGEPYIPASTLRGLIRTLLEDRPQEHWRLCGTARQALDPGVPEEQRDPGNAGAMRLYDARWARGQAFEQRLETRVALDAVTRTAGDHLLFTDSLIPSGAGFDCRFELDRVDEDDLAAFLGALRALAHTAGIGAGRSLMQGGLEWVAGHERVHVLTRSRFLDWLLADAEPLESYFDPDPGRRAEPHEPEAGRDGVHLPLTIETRIRPQAPLLVSPRRGEKGNEEPNLVFRQEDGQLYIPASSLKGMLRAQCRRILLTRLASDDQQAEDDRCIEVADAMVGFLFGSTSARARLYVGAAQGAFTKDDEHRQFFNALDRFTGGVAEHRLYNVTAVLPKELPWDIELQPKLLETHWALGLLAYVLRDAMEGDLSIGWGRARGYGAFRLTLKLPGGEVLSDWSELLRRLDAGGLGIGRGRAEAWLEALEQEIDKRMQAPDSAAQEGGL